MITDLSKRKTILGTGLITLDIIDSPENYFEFTGGSCGNVLTILSHLGWTAMPIGRLKNNGVSNKIIQDFQKWNVNTELLDIDPSGSSPVIVQKNYINKNGILSHRFEFYEENEKTRFPLYRPILKSNVGSIIEKVSRPQVFYFDRLSPAIIELAKFYAQKGAFIYFEPSSISNKDLFYKVLPFIDVLKYSADRVNTELNYPVDSSFVEIVTLGNQGLRYRIDQNSNWTISKSIVIEEDQMIDASGAGDWLSAGFIHKLLYSTNTIGKKLDKSRVSNALSFGQLLSSINCYFPGARGIMYELQRIQPSLKIVDIDNNSILKKHNKSIYFENENSCQILPV